MAKTPTGSKMTKQIIVREGLMLIIMVTDIINNIIPSISNLSP